jgi:putative MATE family efflux protein
MKNILDLLKESLNSEESKDFTSVSINKAIFLLSIPMIIEMIFESFFALADAFFVAKFVGIEGIATVGLTESVLTLIYSLAWGFSTAATALISRRIGEKNPIAAGNALAQVILISIVLGIIISFFGYFYSESILQLMGAEKSVIENGIWYTKIQFLSAPIIILLFTLGGALRGAGNAAVAMKAMIIANIINIIIDFILIPVLGFGVEGAAIATLIGRSIGVIFQLYMLLNGGMELKLTRKALVPDFALIKTIVSVASGGAGQFLIQSASWVFLTRILSQFGSEVVAGYTIAIRIIVFTILPSWGMANASATLVGQNLGANKPDRAETSAWRASFLNMIFLSLIAILFFVFSKDMAMIFTDSKKVIDTASGCLKILSLGYVFFGFGMVMAQSINGAGDTVTPTILNLICFWAIEIPLAYYLANYLNMGYDGVFYSIIISESLLAVLAVIYFKTGRWKKTVV